MYRQLEINEGGVLNHWVYDGPVPCWAKLNWWHCWVAITVSAWALKAIAEKHPSFGILQIDAHCDLRASYELLHL